MCSSRAVDAEKPGSASSPSSQYNIGNLVELVNRLHNLLLPLIVFYQVAVFIVRWESPVVTSCVWFVSVIVTYHMETGHVIFCCFMTLASIASVGALIRQSKTQSLESSSKKKLNAVATTGNTGTTPAQRAGATRDVEIDRRHRLLEEFRQYMIGSQELLLSCCTTIEFCQEVLMWGHPRISPMFYAGSFVSLVIVSVLPIRWCVILLISCAFSANHVTFSSLINVHESLKSQVTTKTNEAEAKKEAEEKEQDVQPVLPVTKEVIQHPEIRIDGASTQTPTPNTPSSEDSTEDEERYQSQKLVSSSSIRERAATAPETAMKGYVNDKPSESGDHHSSPSTSGHCFQCGAAFTSVLKRRKYCRHCGNDFCSKCCKHKLPRAAFGATAPAAQTEKELVCNACFLQLTAEESATLIS